MYGLIIEAIVTYIQQTYGEEAWSKIRTKAGLDNECFSTHERYSESIIPVIANAVVEITGEDYENLLDAFGVSFVSFVGKYGYDRMLKVLGRHMRDFLNGLDNLHEYLRFSYPKMRPPSFFCENENKSGLTLHYRTRRKGYLNYVMGQIRQVGVMFYNTKVDIYVISQEELNDGTQHVVFRLLFNNTAFREQQMKLSQENYIENIPISSEHIFNLFPFHVVFSRNLQVKSIGAGLAAVMPNIMGTKLVDQFELKRPLLPLLWDNILSHTNNVFELLSKEPVGREYHCVTQEKTDTTPSDSKYSTVDTASESNRLLLKGQMMFMLEWNAVIFLGSPKMESLDEMFQAGLYINDLSMHDSSRDLVLAGTQQSVELKLALDQEQQKSRLLRESMAKLDAEMKRTDALLYQMIPKTVADRLRKGEPAVSTCEVFESVTILFSDVVGFTTICSQITPMEVVSMLNAMYTKFDKLTEQHQAYKVETIGDAYMVVSGAPIVTKFHALQICDMALDMLSSMWDLIDPSTGGNMKIRVGCHSGTAVAGVVGIKMPRYCFFGDTVNMASRMETNGKAMRIHISETTKRELDDFTYITEERGTIEVKGKGEMKTYWLLGKSDVPNDNIPKCPFSALISDQFTSANNGNGRGDCGVDKVAMRPVYSPVSFEDIPASKACRSLPHSPQKQAAHSQTNCPKSNSEKGSLCEEAKRKEDILGVPKDVSAKLTTTATKNYSQDSSVDQSKSPNTKSFTSSGEEDVVKTSFHDTSLTNSLNTTVPSSNANALLNSSSKVLNLQSKSNYEIKNSLQDSSVRKSKSTSFAPSNLDVVKNSLQDSSVVQTKNTSSPGVDVVRNSFHNPEKNHESNNSTSTAAVKKCPFDTSALDFNTSDQSTDDT